jgi:hypothetical protein
VSYQNLNVLADAGRWRDLLDFAAGVESAPVVVRREVAHVVALEGPPEIAAAAAELFADDDEGYAGPLWEVVAHRPWQDLAAHLTNPRTRHLVAQTRVLHGEDLRSVTDLNPAMFRVPLRLQSWETASWNSEMDMPTYNRTGSAGCTTWAHPGHLIDPTPLPAAAAEPVQHDALAVLDGLSSAVRAYVFRADAWQAAATVAVDRPRTARGASRQATATRMGSRVAFGDGYRDLVHLAAGERAYTRRTGQALGRIAVWDALAGMAGSPPVDAGTVTAFVDRLQCVGWREPDDDVWYLHLAMEDPEQALSWVLTGNDFD